MAGASDPPFRRAAQSFGCRYSVSEIVAAEPLARARRDVLARAAGQGIAPLVVQLAGREPEWIARGARIAADLGAAVIDLNMGCPAKQVTSGACGSALMRDLDRAERLIAAACAAVALPVTVKMRLGWDDAQRNAPELARRAEQAGAAMLVVHGRTRSQFFKGSADWAAIRPVVEATRLPVVANGDVHDAASARAALAQSGAAGVMVGRAAMGKPWLVGALGRALASGAPAPSPPAFATRWRALAALVDDSLHFYGAPLGLKIVRKQLAAAVDAEDWPGAEAQRRSLREALCTAPTPAPVLEVLETIAAAGLEAAPSRIRAMRGAHELANAALGH
jgi:nifR3 family TIM-barrel protein